MAKDRDTLKRIMKRIMKFLTAKGFLIQEQGTTYLSETDPNPRLGRLQAVACTYRIAFCPGPAGEPGTGMLPAWRAEDAKC
jgi:hypothetical protein